MRLYNLLNCLSLPASLVAGASGLILPGRSIERLASDDLTTGDTVRSFTHEESGAKEFELRAGSSPVREARFWSRNLDGQYYPPNFTGGFVISCISVLFNNRDEKRIGDEDDYNLHYSEYYREESGDILNMTIYSGSYVDAVSYTVKEGTVTMGGSGGQPQEQDVGNGVLLGFKGTFEGGYVKTLEAIFKH